MNQQNGSNKHDCNNSTERKVIVTSERYCTVHVGFKIYQSRCTAPTVIHAYSRLTRLGQRVFGFVIILKELEDGTSFIEGIRSLPCSYSRLPGKDTDLNTKNNTHDKT